ncbi:MAG: FliM/FliN family flagellar motor switch protein [Gemmatimonadota bacterium]|nr:FliM/FliN family flagellar motor switch protein [Gemmatimonadota bacterium]
MDQNPNTPKVRKIDMEHFDAPLDVDNPLHLKRLNDVSLEMKAELGKCRVTLKEVLGWKKDTILTLDKLAGENVDVYIHDTRFASGEVLVMDDNFAVRLTELLTYLERVKLGLSRVTE